jgi:hypothetical protein
VKKARKAKLLVGAKRQGKRSRKQIAEELFRLSELAQANGWSAEELLRSEAARRERDWRKREAAT